MGQNRFIHEIERERKAQAREFFVDVFGGIALLLVIILGLIYVVPAFL